MSLDPSVRPRHHFTPRRGWLNDPNGLVRHDGEWHLFFQHSPDTIVWGPMSWGHAVSADLVAWTELPVALASTEAEHMWSGSVVHDATDSSGLSPDGSGALVAIYTRFDPTTKVQSQCLAHSSDRGRTWEPYAGNPVLDIGSTAFRDPKVLRHGDGWLMVLVLADDRTVEVYRSPDLVRWEHASSFGPAGSVAGVWECPDLLRVPVGGSEETAAVMLVSVLEGAPAGGTGVQYFVGELDGDTFRATQEARWMDHGADFYAAVSYSGDVGREPVVQGWMSNWRYADQVPATDFRGSMTLARRLVLRPRDGELVLVQQPVVPVGERVVDMSGQDLTGTLRLPVEAASYRVVVEIDPRTASRTGLRLRVGADGSADGNGGQATIVLVDHDARTVGLDRTASGAPVHPDFPAVHTAPLPGADGPVRLEVVVDVSSVEVFVGDGELTLTDQVFPAAGSLGIEVFAEGGTARIGLLEVLV